jgi:uncharacterized membrane protein
MKYYIQRQLSEYGPYTLADLQRYVAQGSILLTDLARSEGMADWVPVSQVLGNIPVPVPSQTLQPSAPTVYGGAAPAAGGTVYGSPGTVYGGATAVPAVGGGPIPPDFHWALVLLINLFCSVFTTIWLFVEAGFVKKIDRESKGIALLAGSLIAVVVGLVAVFGIAAGSRSDDPPSFVSIPFILFMIASMVMYLMAVFQMRSSMEKYYNTVEPINLRLSGVMTFFFAVYYFQYHFSRIAAWKKTGYIQPQ